MPLTQGEVITGENGKVTYGAAPEGVDLVDFAINLSSDPTETTDNSSSGWGTFKPGKITKWDGTINVLLKAGVSGIPRNQIVSAVFTADDGVTYTGNIIVTKKGTTVNTTDNNAVKVAYSFQGTGELQEANAAA